MERSFCKISITIDAITTYNLCNYFTIVLIFSLHIPVKITLYIEINIINSYDCIYIYVEENRNMIFIDGNNSYFSNRANEERREADEKSFVSN